MPRGSTGIYGEKRKNGVWKSAAVLPGVKPGQARQTMTEGFFLGVEPRSGLSGQRSRPGQPRRQGRCWAFRQTIEQATSAAVSGERAVCGGWALGRQGRSFAGARTSPSSRNKGLALDAQSLLDFGSARANPPSSGRPRLWPTEKKKKGAGQEPGSGSSSKTLHVDPRVATWGRHSMAALSTSSRRPQPIARVAQRTELVRVCLQKKKTGGGGVVGVFRGRVPRLSPGILCRKS